MKAVCVLLKQFIFLLRAHDGGSHDILVTIEYVIAEGPVDHICIVHVVASKNFSQSILY